MLKMIHKVIEKNYNSWENFLSGDIYYFWKEDSSTNITEPASKSLVAVHAAFNDMKSLEQEVRYLINSLHEDVRKIYNITVKAHLANHISAVSLLCI